MRGSLIDSIFKHNVIFSYGTQVLGLAAGFVFVTIITRYSGIDIYGMIAMMMAVSGTITQLLTFRTNESVVNFYKIGEEEENLGLCRMALLYGLVLDIVVGLVILIAIHVISYDIAEKLLKYPGAASGVGIFAIFMFVNFLRGTPIGLLMAEERFRLINILNLLERLLKILLLAFVVWINIPLSFDNIMWILLISATIITVILYSFPLVKLFGPLRKAVTQSGFFGRYLRFSTSTFISSSLKAGSRHLDSIILGYLTNPSIVGIYNLFRQFLSPIPLLAEPFRLQIYPRFVQAVSRKNPDGITVTISHTNRILIAGNVGILILVTSLMVGYSYWLDLNLGLQHYVLYALMALSALIIQRLWWSRPFSIAINPAMSVHAGLLTTLILPVMVFLLVSTMGFVGVGYGVLITYLIMYMFWQNKLKRVQVLVENV